MIVSQLFFETVLREVFFCRAANFPERARCSLSRSHRATVTQTTEVAASCKVTTDGPVQDPACQPRSAVETHRGFQDTGLTVPGPQVHCACSQHQHIQSEMPICLDGCNFKPEQIKTLTQSTMYICNQGYQ